MRDLASLTGIRSAEDIRKPFHVTARVELPHELLRPPIDPKKAGAEQFHLRHRPSQANNERKVLMNRPLTVLHGPGKRGCAPQRMHRVDPRIRPRVSFAAVSHLSDAEQ